MTLKEMDEVIQEYCESVDCENCIIETECRHCDGYFESSQDDCSHAYEVICNSREHNVDIINHPPHYTRDGAMECIDEMQLVFGKEAVINFCLCNVWKYRYRAADKGGEEDLRKSDYYLRKYKELINGTDNQ